jgi:hypothetical protein
VKNKCLKAGFKIYLFHRKFWTTSVVFCFVLIFVGGCGSTGKQRVLERIDSLERLNLLVLGPLDALGYYKYLSTDQLRSLFTKKIIPNVADTFGVIGRDSAIRALKELPEAKNLTFRRYKELSLLSKDNYRLTRMFGKKLGADFVLLLVRGSEPFRSDFFSTILIDVEDEQGVYIKQDKFRYGGVEDVLTPMFKYLVSQAEPAMVDALFRKTVALQRTEGGNVDSVELEKLRKLSNSLKAEAEIRAEKARQERALLEAKLKKSEQLRMEAESELEKALSAEREQLTRKLEEERQGRFLESPYKQPAAIFLRSPKESNRIETETVQLDAVVVSQVNIAKVEVLLNDTAAIVRDGRGIDIVPSEKTHDLQLFRTIKADLGKNEVKVIVTTEEGIISEKSVHFTRERPVGNIYAVVIGVNDYLNVPKLRFAVQDAEAFSEFLTKYVGVPRENVKLLVDEEVTLRSMRIEMGGALPRKVEKKDTVIIFYAGHGGTDADDANIDDDGLEKYLMPYDAEPEELFGTAMSMSDLQKTFGRIRSDRLIFIADACYSGAAGGRTIISSRRATVSENFLNRLSSGKGRIILTARPWCFHILPN